jgi:uncharacterized membrane protein
MIVWIFALITVATVVALISYLLWVGAQWQPASPDQKLPTREEMRQFLLWRSFYVNPDDPRGWVPKTWGSGMTVNFRTKRSAGIFAGLILVCLLAAGGMTVAALCGC